MVEELSKLPGIGRRTALRLAMHLLRMEPSIVAGMTRSIDRFRREIRYCRECNNLSDTDVCPICEDPKRDRSTICVVEQVAGGFIMCWAASSRPCRESRPPT